MGMCQSRSLEFIGFSGRRFTAAAMLTALVISGCGSGDPPQPGDDRTQDAAVETRTPTPSAPGLDAGVQSALNGVYAIDSTVVSTEFSGSAPGTVTKLTWTLQFDCTATPCSGTITSAGGAVYDVSFDGRRITGMSKRQEEVPCVDEASGEEGGTATADSQNVVDLQLDADPATGARLTGTLAQTGTVLSVVAPCTDEPGTVRTSRSTLTGTKTA